MKRPDIAPVQTLTFANIVTVALLAGGCFFVWGSVARAKENSAGAAARAVSIEGANVLQLDAVRERFRISAVHDPLDSPLVVYVFATSCALCQTQRRAVADLLSALPSAAVLTLSPEPASMIGDYWKDLKIDWLPQSESVKSLGDMGVTAVPMLLFANSKGRIVSAWSGSIGGWTDQQIMDEFAKAQHDTVQASSFQNERLEDTVLMSGDSSQ